MADNNQNPQLALTAAGIGRVSLDNQRKNYSLETQANKYISLEEKFGPWTMPDQYVLDDGGYSGANFNRPALKKAVRLLCEGRINAVIFPYLDRFARNVEGGLMAIRQLRDAGAKVLVGDYGWVSDERHFRSQLLLGLMVAEWQREDIVERSKDAVKTKIRRGRAHGGRSPFVWRFVTALEMAAEAMRTGQPVPEGKPNNVHKRVPRDEETLRLMGDLALGGQSANGISRELFARGIKSPKGNAVWDPSVISHILHDEVYHTGIWRYGKREGVAPKKYRKPQLIDRKRTKSSWKRRPESDCIPQALEGGPVWTEAEQKAIIEALERNGRRSVGKPAGENGRVSILKQMLKCVCAIKPGEERGGEECGSGIYPKTKGKRNYYVCNGRYRGGPNCGRHFCDGKWQRAEPLEEAIFKAWRETLTVKLTGLVELYQKQLIETTVDAEELEQMKADEQRLIRKKHEAMDAKLEADSIEDKSHYASKVAEYQAQLALLRRRIETLTVETAALVVDYATIRREVEAAARTKDPADRRAILLTWIHDRIRFNSRTGEAEITLQIPLSGATAMHGTTYTGANYEKEEHPSRNYTPYIPLKIKVQVAA